MIACFDVIGSLPMKREIKHDLPQLSAKLLECQIRLGLDPIFDQKWDFPRNLLMEKVNNLSSLIEAEAKARGC